MENRVGSLICQETLRRILLAVRPPADQPELIQALRVVARAFTALGSAVGQPAPVLRELIVETGGLDGPIEARTGALHRRLSRYGAWRLLLSVREDVPEQVLAAIGAEIAFAVIRGSTVPEGRANALRQACGPGGARAAEKLLNSILLSARVRFAVGHVSAPTRSQADALSSYYKALFHYTGEHAQQARRDRRTLSDGLFRTAARAIRQGAERDDSRAIFFALRAVTGLSDELTRALPLRSAADETWSAVLDLDAGTYALDLDVVAAGARGAPIQGCIPASRILVRPLPQFLHSALRRKGALVEDALTVDELLGCPQCTERDLVTDHGFESGIRPSIARFGNSVELTIVAAGVHRVIAGHLSGRYQSTTRSKRYYAVISRDAIWSAAARFFDSVGWGEPVPLQAGLACGAQAVPEDEAIRQWHAWLRDEVQLAQPGRHGGRARLIDCHNRLSLAAASVIVFALALREGERIPLQADIDIGGTFEGVLDKRSPSAWAPDGRSAGPHPTPMPATVRYQIDLYRRHCAALARRLRRFPELAEVAEQLSRIGHHAAVPLFIWIDRRDQPRPVSTRHLVRWWPERFGLSGNFSRGFWQSRLIERDIPSRVIDRLLRHVLSGERMLSSDAGEGLSDQLWQLSQALSAEMHRLGVEPIRGLVR